MKRKIDIAETRLFSRSVNILLKKGQLDAEDFEDFKKKLIENPEIGDIIPGVGGVRKTRLKSASKGKRGGFRVCYYYLVRKEIIYLIWIYAKNVQENLSTEEKSILKKTIDIIKRAL